MSDKYEWEEIDPRVGFARFWLPKSFGARVRKVRLSERDHFLDRWEAHGIINFTEASSAGYTVTAVLRSAAIDGIESWLKQTAEIEYKKRVEKPDPFKRIRSEEGQ